MTAAAKTLFISQPGVSLHLSSLESYVGHQLFERKPRRLAPTEYGKLLYNSIVDAINNLQEAEKNFQKGTRKNTPSVTIDMCFETFLATQL
jgi:DNA-binding transcriptional LysR family regulator